MRVKARGSGDYASPCININSCLAASNVDMTLNNTKSLSEVILWLLYEDNVGGPV